MKQQLRVLTRNSSSADSYDVNWSSGLNTQGILRVHVTVPLTDKALCAELFAIQYLLEVLEVCGSDRAGNNLKIIASRGAVRKIQKCKYSKEEYLDYGTFLATRFVEAEIEVDATDGFIKPRAQNHLVELTVDGPPEPSIRLGQRMVRVSRHAIERVAQRWCAENPSRAWRLLQDIAADGQTTQVRHMKAAEAEARHGVSADYYYNSAHKMLMVVSPRPVHTLVTVRYERKWFGA